MKHLNWRSVYGYYALFLLSLGRYLAPVFGLTRWHFRFVVRQIRRTGLFDATYYSECFPEFNGSAYECLMHFVVSGDKQGQHPSFLLAMSLLIVEPHSYPARQTKRREETGSHEPDRSSFASQDNWQGNE